MPDSPVKKRTWRRIVRGAFLAGLALTVAAVVTVVVAYERTTIPTVVSAAARAQSTEVFFSDGSLIGTFSTGLNRQVLSAAQMPEVLRQAAVAAEDRRFYTEGGVSLSGIARAAYEDVRGGGDLQGGSTITEQLAKNYYASIGPSRTAGVKIREIFVAIKLAHRYSKTRIMTQYLNTVYLGADCYGVGAAAQAYFGIPASRLNLAQAAMLAAMINQPGFFSPDPSAGPAYRELVARWHYVLDNMVRDHAISRRTARAQRFPAVSADAAGLTGYRGYLMQMVQQELESTYGLTGQQISAGGLRVTTTFSQSQVRGLQQLVGSSATLPPDAHVGAVIEQAGTGAITAVYGGPGYGVPHCALVSCEYNMAEAPNEAGSSIEPYAQAARLLGVPLVSLAKQLGVGQSPLSQGSNDLRTLAATADMPEQANLTAVEQAAALATVADRGVYHAPHVVAALTWERFRIPVAVTTRRILPPKLAAVLVRKSEFLVAPPVPAAERIQAAGLAPQPQAPCSVFSARAGLNLTLPVTALASSSDGVQTWSGGATGQSAMSVGLFADRPAELPGLPRHGVPPALPDAIFKSAVGTLLPPAPSGCS